MPRIGIVAEAGGPVIHRIQLTDYFPRYLLFRASRLCCNAAHHAT